MTPHNVGIYPDIIINNMVLAWPVGHADKHVTCMLAGRRELQHKVVHSRVVMEGNHEILKYQSPPLILLNLGLQFFDACFGRESVKGANQFF